MTGAVKHLSLCIFPCITDGEAEEKTIELTLWEWPSSVLFSRVLRSDDPKGSLELMADSVETDLSFFHRLKETRLRAWGGSVELISDQDLCKERARVELKTLRRGIENIDPDQITGEQITRELDPL